MSPYNCLGSPLRLESVLMVLVVLAAACGGESETLPAAGSCADETRAEDYVAGMEKTGTGGVKVVLLESSPTPPRKGNNDWHIQVMDGQRDPLAGLAIDVVPEMPDHGHDSVIYPAITEVEGQSGEYMLSPVRLWMPGYWQINVTVDDGAGLRDRVQFKLCIEG